MKKIILFINLLLLITGCSHYATTGEKLYLSSRNGNGQVVPPPLTDNNISHFYDLPQQTQPAKVSIEPPNL